MNNEYAKPIEETPLYVASKLGLEHEVKILLTTAIDPRIDLERSESVRAWTPLIVACVESHLSTVKLLLAAGANQWKTDRYNWTAKEHAAFRGYLDIAALFDSDVVTTQRLPLSRYLEYPAIVSPRIRNQSHALITLRSSNTREKVNVVDLSPQYNREAGEALLDTGYGLEIRAIGAVECDEENRCVQMPIEEEMLNQPWTFTTGNADQVKLVFSVTISTGDQHVKRSVVGSAIAILQSLKHGLAPAREGLTRYHTIPLLKKDTLDYMGSVKFGLLLVTPPPQKPNVPLAAKQGFWMEGGPTQIIGHRGSGPNSSARNDLQLGENTIQSYESAAALGATGVEFDVQLTKDLVPVIFHDFLVTEAGGDTPLWTLRLDQFQHLSKAQTPKGDLPSMAEQRYLVQTKDSNASPRKPRSYSLSQYDDSPMLDLVERTKYTESANEGSHKGNLRGETIHGIFPAFEDLFTKLPESIAFNVEMKYPMLWEAEERNMDRYAPEINTYINIVLEVIYRLAGKRSMTFSSFSPEVCIALSLKQQDYPVLFLSKGGSVPVGDIRCSGLEQSIRFAKQWNLAGIVILSDPLVMCPRLVNYAKSTGLKVCSYGLLNNDLECAKIQAKAKLDVIVVDKVRLVVETLAGLALES